MKLDSLGYLKKKLENEIIDWKGGKSDIPGPFTDMLLVT